jgi:hypothetical protein
MPWMLKGNCVHKKNEDGSIGAVVKCHGSRDEAVNHMRALYKNVPDAKRYTEMYGVESEFDFGTGQFPFNRYEFADAKKKANKPYGDVKYADPKNGKYPIDTETHVRAALSYVNMPKNAAKYPLNGVTLSQVKARIYAAAKRLGIKVEVK